MFNYNGALQYLFCQTSLRGYYLGETVNETGKLDGQNLINCRTILKLLKEMGDC